MSAREKKRFLIYIPEEGDWDLGLHVNKAAARKAYLKWAGRKHVPRGAKFWSP